MEDDTRYVNPFMEEEILPVSLKTKILSVSAMALHLFIFFYLLPLDVAENYSTAFAIIGGFIALILSFWIAFAVLPKLFDVVPIFVALTCISTLFIFGYFFILRTHNFATNELEKNGVQTMSVVIDKSQWYGKRGRTTQDIEVAFYDATGATQYATILVNKEEYSNYHIRKKIPITYSSAYPSVARIDYHRMNRF